MYHIPKLQEESFVLSLLLLYHSIITSFLFLVFLMKIFSQSNNNQK